MAVVEVIKARTSRDSKVMHLLQCLHFFTAKHDIYITAVHVPGVDNIRADALVNNADFFGRSHLEYAWRRWCLKICGPSLLSWR